MPLGRHVKQGEKGIVILAPVIHKVEQETDSGAPESIRALSGFRTISVFDVELPSGEPLPRRSLHLQGDDQGLFDHLLTFATSIGIPVNIKLIKANGYCRYSQGKPVEIAINTELMPLHRAKTLAHELGHALLHTPDQYSERGHGTGG